MTWERDPLLAKSKLFFGRALDTDRDEPEFGLWCAFGLELLARAAVASISPALLAEPDRDQNSLLHVLGKGRARTGAKSIVASQVVKLCEYLFEEFTSEHTTAAVALVNRRNEELHSGANAFADYTTQHWLPGFYASCEALGRVLGVSLDVLFGDEEAKEARLVLAGAAAETRKRVGEAVRAHRNVFEARPADERDEAQKRAEEAVKALVFQRHHRVSCPACASASTVEGQPFGPEKVTHDEDESEVVVRQAVAPRKFSCSACGLKLDGYADLAAAGLGNQYTRTSRYSPEAYFELIHPDDFDTIRDIYESQMGPEYDNE